jgi:hypothetical protein
MALNISRILARIPWSKHVRITGKSEMATNTMFDPKGRVLWLQ